MRRRASGTGTSVAGAPRRPSGAARPGPRTPLTSADGAAAGTGTSRHRAPAGARPPAAATTPHAAVRSGLCPGGRVPVSGAAPRRRQVSVSTFPVLEPSPRPVLRRSVARPSDTVRSSATTASCARPPSGAQEAALQQSAARRLRVSRTPLADFEEGRRFVTGDLPWRIKALFEPAPEPAGGDSRPTRPCGVAGLRAVSRAPPCARGRWPRPGWPPAASRRCW